MPREGWTAEEARLFVDLIAAGKTFGQIADEMKKTRAAVSGKCRRMKLRSTSKSQFTPKTRPPPKPKKAAPPPAPKIVIPRPEPIGPLNAFPERDCCKWTDDMPGSGDWRMCGQPAINEGPWCAFHFKEAHAPKNAA